MDLQSIATESQTLRSTIRDKRSVIATDEERLERHRNELKVALLRLDELESDAQLAFAAIRTVGSEPPPVEQASIFGGAVRVEDAESPFGEPEQQSAA